MTLDVFTTFLFWHLTLFSINASPRRALYFGAKFQNVPIRLLQETEGLQFRKKKKSSNGKWNKRHWRRLIWANGCPVSNNRVQKQTLNKKLPTSWKLRLNDLFSQKVQKVRQMAMFNITADKCVGITVHVWPQCIKNRLCTWYLCLKMIDGSDIDCYDWMIEIDFGRL